MNLFGIFNQFKKPAALILALIMSFALLGCTASEVGEILDIAGDVIEILEDTGEYGMDLESADADVTESESRTDAESETETESKTDTKSETKSPETEAETSEKIDEGGKYYSRDDVALYIHTYGKLPDNFITKSEAGELGWEGGSVEKYSEGCAIGGDKFGNREGKLPKKSGRVYRECDIDTLGKSSRGAKRIVFSNDGLIYYTDDHYENFTLLYGEE